MIITNELRGRITHALLAHAFAAPLAAFLATEGPLITDLYVRAYPADERKAMQLLNERHKGSIVTRHSAIVNVAGAKITVGSGGRHDGRGAMQPILPPHENTGILVVDKHQHSEPMLALEDDSTLGKIVMDYAKAREQLNEQIAQRRTEITGVLADIRTDGQLRERWPEAMPIAAPILKIEPKVQVPMVPLGELNAALGLPPQTEG